MPTVPTCLLACLAPEREPSTVQIAGALSRKPAGIGPAHPGHDESRPRDPDIDALSAKVPVELILRASLGGTDRPLCDSYRRKAVSPLSARSCRSAKRRSQASKTACRHTLAATTLVVAVAPFPETCVGCSQGRDPSFLGHCSAARPCHASTPCRLGVSKNFKQSLRHGNLRHFLC